MQWIEFSAPPPSELWDTVGSGDPHPAYDLWQCSDPSDSDGMFGSDPSPSTCPSPRLHQPSEYSLDDHHRGANDVPFGPSTDPSPVSSTSHDTARIVVLPTIQPATPSKHGDDFNNVEPHHPSSPRFVPSYHRPASSCEQRHGSDALPQRLHKAHIEVESEERIHELDYNNVRQDAARTFAANISPSLQETDLCRSYERLASLRPFRERRKSGMHHTCAVSNFRSTPRLPPPRRLSRSAPRVHPPHAHSQCTHPPPRRAVQEDVTHARARIARTSSVVQCQCHVLGHTSLSRPSRAESEGLCSSSSSSSRARGSPSRDRPLFLRGERHLSEWPPTHRRGAFTASQTRTSSDSAPGLGLCWAGHSCSKSSEQSRRRRVALEPTGMDLCALLDRDAGVDGGVDGCLKEAGEWSHTQCPECTAASCSHHDG